MFRRIASLCGETRFAQDAEEEFSWLTQETSGRVANVV